jgi:hypothetical protein
MKISYIKNPQDAATYLKDHGLELIVMASKGNVNVDVNEKLLTKDPYKPDLVDLCRLHRFVLENKRTTILEFGTGWSTWVFADALSKLKSRHGEEVASLRRNNAFELHVVDDEPDFIRLSESRLPAHLRSIVTFHERPAIMSTFNQRICTFYEAIPHVSPDFIYVDGPNQFNVKKDVGGWSTRHKDMMPMCGDVLRFEHFLTPGTIIVFDGRTANARFVKANLQREWSYSYEEEFDQHIFLMSEAPLGKYNKRQLDFYSRTS